MSKFVKLTPRLLKKIIAEEKLKIKKEQLAEAKKARSKKKKKLKISKKKLLELALIHKRQKQAAAKFKKLHEQKEKIKNSLRK